MVQEDDNFVINGMIPIEPLSTESFGKIIFDRLLLNIDKDEAMIDAITNETVSYRDLLDLTCCLAEKFLETGCGLNTIITISSENSTHFFTPIIAALYIGAIVAPLNHNYTEIEIAHSLDITKSEIIFCSQRLLKKYLDIKKKRGHIKRIIVIDSIEEINDVETIHSLIASKLAGYNPHKFQPAYFDAATQVAFILLSSGTTGLPKAVMLTHTNIVVRYMHTLDKRFVSDYPSFLGILPFFHAYGLVTSLIAMILGQKLVVVQRFEVELFLRTIEKYRINELWVAPPILVLLAKSPSVAKYDLSSLCELTSAAAPLSKAIEQKVKERINIKFIRQAYGFTEATNSTHMVPLNEERPGSSGRLVPYMRAKVRDPETGRSLGPHQVGELCFKGPMVMKGYYGNEEATKNCFTSDSWLLSGDLGYYDKDQYFFIVDRLKELIKYKGFQVAPAELEAILLTNPKIADAGVVGVPHEEAGELPLAFVVKKPNVNLTEKEVEKYVSDCVSPQKRLRGGVIFLPAIPKSLSGKILRRELRLLLNKYKSGN